MGSDFPLSFKLVYNPRRKKGRKLDGKWQMAPGTEGTPWQSWQ